MLSYSLILGTYHGCREKLYFLLHCLKIRHYFLVLFGLNLVSMKEIVIIGNNKAGQGNIEVEFQQAKLTLSDWPLRFLTPQSVHEFCKMLSDLDPIQTLALIVMGGDGTQNLALKFLSEKAIPLIPFPMGTANDLALSIGLKKDWGQVKELLKKQKITNLDLINLGGHLFCTVGGLGLGADLLDEFNNQRKEKLQSTFLQRILKGQIYTYLSTKIILKKWGKGHLLKISSQEFNQEVTTAALFICNQSFLGKDLLVAPKANTQDGKMDIMIIPTESNHRMLWGLAQMKIRRHPQTFIKFQTQKLVIKNLGKELPLYFADGEVFHFSTQEVICEVSPLKLKVYNF